MKEYDAIIIGAGHNGLVTAAYLAKAAKSVLVLESRETLGGAASTEEIFPGFKFNSGAEDVGLFRSEIVDDLNLDKHGFETYETSATATALANDGTSLTLWRDVSKTQSEIEKFSKTDAEKYPKFLAQISKMAKVLSGTQLKLPPEPGQSNFAELLPWLRSALELKGLGKQEMMAFLRILPMSARELLDDWFETELLKGLLAANSVVGSMQGPMAAGTAFMLIYQCRDNFFPARFVRGGAGQLSAAIAASAKKSGVDIRLGAEAGSILISEYKATGVALKNGEKIQSDLVISNADPRRTFFGLVGAPNLSPEFNRKVQNIRLLGTTAKLNLALRDLPDLSKYIDNNEKNLGYLIVCPTVEYLERAFDAAKYGIFSEAPTLKIRIPTLQDESLSPAGQHVMSITMQYAPFDLRDSNWVKERDALAKKILNTLSEYLPDLEKLILHQQLLTPLDLQETYGLTEGSIFQGQMALDQLLMMRPIPGFGRYQTPVNNLYLCGAGTHPGGGLTGAPGYNAAKEILKK